MDNTRSRQQLRAIMKLRELVISGKFAPGERISELAAVELLDISRTPVRLALSALAHEGLLEPLSSGGFVVRHFAISDIEDAIDIRGVLEGTAARMAAERNSGPTHTVKLRSIIEDIDTLLEADGSEETLEDYIELNEAFHKELMVLADCPLLERSLAQVTALPFASPNSFVKLQAHQARNKNHLLIAQFQHKSILDAIEAGQSNRAMAVGHEHARLAITNLRQVMKEEGLFSSVPGAQLIRRDEDEKQPVTEE